MHIDDDQFQHFIDEAFESLPKEHRDNVRNVAILYEDEPSPEQRVQLKLLPHQSLYGLYEGTPLAFRQGVTHYLPDRITLFKLPLLANSRDVASLRENIRHTLWHEIAHYYGLDHDKIRELEK